MKRIDIDMPRNWRELSQSQLKFVFSLIAVEVSADYLKMACFLKWSGIKLISSDAGAGDCLLKFNKSVFRISYEELAMAVRALNWLEDVPDFPCPILKIGRHKALDPLFREVKFDSYLSAVSVWSAYLESKKPEDMTDIIGILYGVKNKKIPKFVNISIIYWLAALQSVFSRFFPDLFNSEKKSSDGTGSLGDGRVKSNADYVNAMIRALTKGDVLKEKEVLEVDTWRALTELNAIAKENRDIRNSINKS